MWQLQPRGLGLERSTSTMKKRFGLWGIGPGPTTYCLRPILEVLYSCEEQDKKKITADTSEHEAKIQKQNIGVAHKMQRDKIQYRQKNHHSGKKNQIKTKKTKAK